MKKLLFVLTMMLFFGISYGQSLQKGNLIGMHVVEIDVEPGVTTDQYMDFYSNEVLPEFNRDFILITTGTKWRNEN